MKVLFNIKKLHFSPIESVDENGKPTYGESIAIPGTVSLSLESEGDSEPFYADGINYYTGPSSASYSGTIENALFGAEVLKKIWGYVEDSNKNLVDTTQPPKEFGAQFAVDSDDGEVYFTLYRVAATRPSLNFQTNEDSQTINPQSIDITVSAIPDEENTTSVLKSYADKNATNYKTYFDAITVPSIPGIGG